MTTAQITEEIIAVIRESTETDVELTAQTHIVNEMNLSSIEAMMMISDLEDHFYITIPSGKLRDVRTVGDLCQTVIEVLK